MVNLTERPVLLVSVGTDHHGFDRLSTWVESWLATSEIDLVCRVQQGNSCVPRGAEALGVMPREDFYKAMAESTVIVCHGGPGSILDARWLGFVPITVPRLVAYGEVVDDHQVAFTRRMDALGWARSAETEEQLHQLLDEAMAHPLSFRCPTPESTAAAAAAELERLVGEIEPRGLRWRRLPHAVNLVRKVLSGVKI